MTKKVTIAVVICYVTLLLSPDMGVAVENHILTKLTKSGEAVTTVSDNDLSQVYGGTESQGYEYNSLENILLCVFAVSFVVAVGRGLYCYKYGVSFWPSDGSVPTQTGPLLNNPS